MAKSETIKPVSIDWYFADTKNDDIVMYVRPMWPVDAKKSDLNEKDLKDFVEKSIGSVDMRKGFLKIETTSTNRALVKFDVDNWLKENFMSSPRVEFYLPGTLEWQWKKNIPSTVFSHVPWNMTKNILEDKFKSFLKSHKKSVFKKKLKLMKKVNFNWFTYEADMQFSKFYVRVKPSVMVTLALVGGAAAKAIMGSSTK